MMLIVLDVEFTARHKCMQHIYSVYELRKTIYSFKKLSNNIIHCLFCIEASNIFRYM